jgi:hypothetical protein
MPEEDFLTNIARMIAATLYYSVSLQTAREMYGKSYFELGVGEKGTVDQMVFGTVAGNYQSVTPENLKKQTAQQPAGFQGQTSKTASS